MVFLNNIARHRTFVKENTQKQFDKSSNIRYNCPSQHPTGGLPSVTASFVSWRDECRDASGRKVLDASSGALTHPGLFCWVLCLCPGGTCS